MDIMITVLFIMCGLSALAISFLVLNHYQLLSEIDVLNDECESLNDDLDEASNTYEAEIDSLRNELQQACDDYLSLSNEYEPIIAQKDAEIASLNNTPDVKSTPELFQGTMPTKEMDAALKLIIDNNKNDFSSAFHWHPTRSDLLSELALWPTDAGSDKVATKGISEMIRDGWIDGRGPYQPTPMLIERIMQHDSLRRLAMKNFVYKFPTKYNHVESPKDDDTRDLPAVDSEFTSPKVDDETLLYRGLMGSSEMEDAVKVIIKAYLGYVVNGGTYSIDLVCYNKQDFGSCMTGMRMLVDSGWLNEIAYDCYRMNQSLLERICTRPELAAKIGKGAK